jgi:hypothetical protein
MLAVAPAAPAAIFTALASVGGDVATFRRSVEETLRNMRTLTTEPAIPPSSTDEDLWASVEILESIAGLMSGVASRRFERTVEHLAPDLLEPLRKARDAAVLGIADHIRALEDFIDGRAADESRAEPGESIPFEQVRRELGLG